MVTSPVIQRILDNAKRYTDDIFDGVMPNTDEAFKAWIKYGVDAQHAELTDYMYQLVETYGVRAIYDAISKVQARRVNHQGGTIHDFDLSTRTKHALLRAGIHTRQEFIIYFRRGGYEALRKISGLGKVGRQEVIASMEQLGIDADSATRQQEAS